MKNALLQRSSLLNFRGQTTLRYRLQTPLCSSLPQPPSKYPPRKETLSNLSSRFCLNEPPMGLPGTSFLAPTSRQTSSSFILCLEESSIFIKRLPWCTWGQWSFLPLVYHSSAPVPGPAFRDLSTSGLVPYPTDYLVTSLKAMKLKFLGWILTSWLTSHVTLSTLLDLSVLNASSDNHFTHFKVKIK